MRDGTDGVINHITTTYRGPKRTIEEKEKLYMESFFHKEKDRLWSIIKKIHFNPDFLRSMGQAPRINLLLHGPPGTGKSTFAYRIAMCLDRDIISLDLRDVNRRSQMYQILNNPRINGDNKEATNCVFVFEEFDISIKLIFALM